MLTLRCSRDFDFYLFESLQSAIDDAAIRAFYAPKHFAASRAWQGFATLQQRGRVIRFDEAPVTAEQVRCVR